jgi:ubiquinone/menaquinone biosynthesis C-methylase UbiE
VTSLFTSFGYFGPDDDRRALAEAARVLAPGGLHVLDFLNRRQALEHPTPVTSRRSGEYRVDEARRIEDGRRVVKEVVIRPAAGGDPLARYEERVTLYGEEELREQLASVGLSVFRTLGDYEGAAFSPAHSPRLLVLSLREEG